MHSRSSKPHFSEWNDQKLLQGATQNPVTRNWATVTAQWRWELRLFWCRSSAFRPTRLKHDNKLSEVPSDKNFSGCLTNLQLIFKDLWGGTTKKNPPLSQHSGETVRFDFLGLFRWPSVGSPHCWDFIVFFLKRQGQYYLLWQYKTSYYIVLYRVIQLFTGTYCAEEKLNISHDIILYCIAWYDRIVPYCGVVLFANNSF